VRHIPFYYIIALTLSMKIASAFLVGKTWNIPSEQKNWRCSITVVFISGVKSMTIWLVLASVHKIISRNWCHISK